MPPPPASVATRRLRVPLVLLAAAAWVLVAPPSVLGHGVATRDARMLATIDGPAVAPLLYLGAKHMVTGYDHLLFLAGVVFYLHRLRDVFLYVSLFTLGHSATLLWGALGGLRADAFLVDAVIGLSVAYKAFENVGGLQTIGWRVDSRLAVLAFGLCHGLGLATKLDDLALSPNGLAVNILSFNAGVEVGQALALLVVVTALAFWRRSPRFAAYAFSANTWLMMLGFLLAGLHLAGYILARP